MVYVVITIDLPCKNVGNNQLAKVVFKRHNTHFYKSRASPESDSSSALIRFYLAFYKYLRPSTRH